MADWIEDKFKFVEKEFEDLVKLTKKDNLEYLMKNIIKIVDTKVFLILATIIFFNRICRDYPNIPKELNMNLCDKSGAKFGHVIEK